MTTAHVLVVSDTHLSDTNPDADRNWDAVVAHAEAAAPDVVVHLGDISADGAHRAEDLDHARDELARIEAPVHVLPGNHDLGDNPFGAESSDVIDVGRLDRYREVFDVDRWCVEVGFWRLVGIDAQLLESGLADEADQWRWLDGQLSGDGPLALFVHKPIAVLDDHHDDIRTPGRYVPPGSRRALLKLVHERGVRLVVSGHVHQRRSATIHGATHVWAPSTWAALPDAVQPTLGEKRCGVAALVLAADGRFDVAFIEPRGLRQQTLDVSRFERPSSLRVV